MATYASNVATLLNELSGQYLDLETAQGLRTAIASLSDELPSALGAVSELVAVMEQ